jgi:hypothetical protein
MKFIAVIAASLLFILPAFAQEAEEDDQPTHIIGNTPAEFGYLLQCAATQLTLMHLHVQVAASITALSSAHPAPQLGLLVDSYKNMADADQAQVELYFNAIKTAVIPQITQSGKIKADEVMHKANEMISDSLSQIMVQLSDAHASYTQQTELEKLLVEQSQGCETLANKVLEHHTI